MFSDEPHRRKPVPPGTTSVPIASAASSIPHRGARPTIIRAAPRGDGSGYTTCAFIMGVCTLVVLFTLAYTLGSSREVKRKEITLHLSSVRLAGLDKRLDDCLAQQNSLARALRSPIALIPETTPLASTSTVPGADPTTTTAATSTSPTSAVPTEPLIPDGELMAALQKQKDNIEGDLSNVELSIKNEATTFQECKLETTNDREAHIGASVKNVTEYLLQLEAEQKALREHIQTMGGVRARKEVDMRSLIRAYELEISALLQATLEKERRERLAARMATAPPPRNNTRGPRPPPVDRAAAMKEAYFAGKLPPRYRSYMRAVFGDVSTTNPPGDQTSERTPRPTRRRP